MYSQNNEDEIVKAYFDSLNPPEHYQFRLLDIGANDGITFSNSRMLIENGWAGYLLEPSSAFIKLYELYENNADIYPLNIGIGNENGTFDFYESGSIINNQDGNLVSSIMPDERWKKATSFVKKQVKFQTFDDFIEMYMVDSIDFVSIDAEGMDWDILKQIDLRLLKTSCVCVEWNSKPELAECFTSYCNQFGLYEINRNDENIIFVKQNN